MEILNIENLSFKYAGSEDFALRNVSLSVKSGDFVVLCGVSGCGKSTLLRLIKREVSPNGEISGKILYRGEEVKSIPERTSTGEIGFVFQNPDTQIVTDKVWHELSFALTNLGMANGEAKVRIAEISNYFGIQDRYFDSTDSLSGGLKQILNLSSVMVTHPKILLLDEPTSQLDPIAASQFISSLQRLNRETGLTVIIAEHRLEELFPIADKVVVMDGGEIMLSGGVQMVGRKMITEFSNHPMAQALPCCMQVFGGASDECPVTVKDGRDYLLERFKPNAKEKTPPVQNADGNAAVELRDVWFRYEKQGEDVLRGLNLTVYEGEHLCVLGGNASGKTTALNVISGNTKPYSGRVKIFGNDIRKYGNSLYKGVLAFLPQNPADVFLAETVEEDYCDYLKNLGYTKEEAEEKIRSVCDKLGIEPLLKRHPLDLSGGEIQKCALGKLLLQEPKLILLDEPTKGLDAKAKRTLSEILRELTANGKTVITVTHDADFAAENADRCVLFFGGNAVACSSPSEFFADNAFYTTAANRIARDVFPNVVTNDELKKAVAEARK